MGRARLDKLDKPTRAKTQPSKTKMVKALRESRGNVTNACKASGVPRPTHYHWLDNDPDYATAVREVQDEMFDTLEDHIFNLAIAAERESDQIRAAEIYLKARAKDRGYGVEKRDQSVSGGLDIKATVQDVRFELPDDKTGPGTSPPMPPGWEAATGGGSPG